MSGAAVGQRAEQPSCDPARFREVMGSFATGVAIVTTTAGDGPHGMTVNSLTSVSLRPPLLLVCLTRGSRTAAAVMERGEFVVNILGTHQEPLSDAFARRQEDHFEDLEVQTTREGLPVLHAAVGHLVCRVSESHDGGDHHIVVGEVARVASVEGTPLIFHRGKYDSLTGRGRDAAFDWYW